MTDHGARRRVVKVAELIGPHVLNHRAPAVAAEHHAQHGIVGRWLKAPG
jgi:hypothetical protein